MAICCLDRLSFHDNLGRKIYLYLDVKYDAFDVRVDYVSREPEAIDKLIMARWKKEPECIYSFVA